jgi:hypothetical protein
MEFENTMRVLFGEAAYRIAGTETNPKHRRKWLQKSLRKLLRLVDALDTRPRHKKILMAELEAVSRALREATDQPSWELVYLFLRLSVTLFGFDAGARCYTLAYWQTPGQRDAECRDPMWTHQERKDAISLRKEVVDQLRGKGFDDFKISLLLNTSEYAVKRLCSNPRLKGTRRKRRAP